MINQEERTYQQTKEQTKGMEVSNFRNERMDRLQDRLNGMTIEDRKKVFKRFVLGVLVFIIVKLCLGIACTRTDRASTTKEVVVKSTREDSLEIVAEKILNYEFKPKTVRSREVEEALDQLVEEDRAEARKDSLERSRKNR